MPLILLIEDRAYLREALRRILEAAGHRVVLASGAGEGLRLFRLRPADVVLCDLCLEDRSGLGVIRELRREWPGVRLVAMSGGGPWWESDVLVAARELGADAALLKPFTMDSLLEAVNGPAPCTA
jgi:DNA-binding response OmpR family regulator